MYTNNKINGAWFMQELLSDEELAKALLEDCKLIIRAGNLGLKSGKTLTLEHLYASISHSPSLYYQSTGWVSRAKKILRSKSI
jgi:hypothetical protein